LTVGNLSFYDNCAGSLSQIKIASIIWYFWSQNTAVGQNIYKIVEAPELLKKSAMSEIDMNIVGNFNQTKSFYLNFPITDSCL